MDQDERFRIALWRMNILGPLVSARLERGDRRAYFAEAAARTHERPDGAHVRISVATIERWYHTYRRGGVHALEPRPRKDRGVSRVIAADVAEQVVALKREKPRRTIEQITEALERARVVRRGQLTRSTMHRLLQSRSLSTRPPRLEQRERRSFLPLHAGDLWMGDAMHGPQVVCQDGQRRKAYLLTQLDAATRFIVHSEFFLSEDARHHEAGLRTAVERYGLPRTYYVDRGAAYVADSLRVICAELGIRLVHTSPGDCEAKGAIERWHRTWRDGLEHELPDTLSLAELNRRHWAWISERYHRRAHATTGQAPLLHMLADREHLRPAPGERELTAIFLHRARRKVRGDGTVRWLGAYLEVPYALAGQRIELRFDPMDPYTPPKVYQDGRFEADTVWLDRHANSTGARKPVREDIPEQLVPPGIDPLALLVRAHEARLGLGDPTTDEEDEP